MPQEAAALEPAQIETIRRWIASGAAWPEGVTIQVAEARPAVLPARSTSRPRNPRHLGYNRDVRPILAENCFPCHGPDKAARKAGLRLDREEIAKGTLASGTVPVVAGAPDKSALVARLLHADEERRMPLAKSGRARLSSEQIATLRRWIAEGAEWEPHWAYIPPVRPTPPATRDSRWVRNAVDAFILAGVEKAGLRPSPEASRAQLAPPPQLRPHGPAAHAGGGPRLRDGHAEGRLRAAGRPPARFAPLRRAHGALLARPRALLGQRRLPQRQRAPDVALPRLGRPGLERQPAVRSLHRRAARRRPAPGRERRRQDRVRLQPAAPDHRGGRRSAQGVPRDLPGRPRQERLERLDGRDARLRAVPRPQVRPVPGARLLRLRGLLRRHQRAARRPPQARRASRRGPEAGTRRARREG